ncbi:CACTA en-spm transposon protein [Cucumis melo var. makuwa]|uniref:CACTA en-spm transposon protein n=1 Tax=Cucumis melo var. makuwa TaxID=1194695 RepID=A0A5A7VGJ3_CUCMM|nr:CACTA en-spm transposon protein [Cucumis melo var. makuwa]
MPSKCYRKALFQCPFFKWADVTSEYIEVVKHQMLTVWKDFKGQNRHHFKKFDDPELSRANPPLDRAIGLRLILPL